MKSFSAALLLLIALLSSSVATFAHAADSPLTLAEAQRLAVERSRQVAGQDAGVFASREMAVAAGQLPDPMLKFGIDNLPIEGSDRFSLSRDFMTMRRIGVMQEFTRADKRRYRAERFEREAERGIAEKTATVATIQRDTALAWLDRYYAEAIAAVIREQSTEAGLEIEAADSAYRAGRGNQADVFAARSTVVLLEDRMSDTNRRIRTARTSLARWVGEAADAPLVGKPEIARIRLDVSTLDTQLAHHPQIAVMNKQVEIAESEVKIAQANQKSDWSVDLMYQKRGSAFSDMVSIGVAIPIQWDQKNRQNRELSAKLAMAAQAEAQRDEMLRGHIAEIRAQVEEWQTGLERGVRYERDLVGLARERTRAAVAAYRGGKATLAADVLPARRNEIEVRMQALQLEMETAKLWAQLNFLIPDGDAFRHGEAGVHDWSGANK
jgi:outer membrane protein TolC